MERFLKMKYDLLQKYYYIDKSPNKEMYELIYNERFKQGIKLGIEINGYPAFYIEKVEIYKMIVDIQRINEQICALGYRLPGVALNQYAQRCLIDEIILTNDIEGVHSTRKEIGAVLADLAEKNKKNRFFGLVNKYVLLNEQHDIKLNRSLDIRVLYDELFYREVQEEDPDDLPDGYIFRTGPVSVTDPTQRVIHEGLMPEQAIIEAMDKALAVLNDQSMEVVIRVALFHYLFGYIHPFYEGNGRMSRFISSYMLTRVLHPLTGYRLSYVIKEDLVHYYKAFKDCNNKLNRGDLTPFILMFTGVLKRMCEEIYEDLDQRYRDFTDLTSVIPQLTDNEQMKDLYHYLLQAALFSESGIPTQRLLELMQMSRPTLLKRLKEIEEKGLLITIMLDKVKYYQLNLDALNMNKE